MSCSYFFIQDATRTSRERCMAKEVTRGSASSKARATDSKSEDYKRQPTSRALHRQVANC